MPEIHQQHAGMLTHNASTSTNHHITKHIDRKGTQLTICVLETTWARAMAMGSSPLSPIMVTSSTRRSNRSARAVSARVSNSVPCCRILVSTSMKAARVCGSLWYPRAGHINKQINHHHHHHHHRIQRHNLRFFIQSPQCTANCLQYVC